MKRRETLDGIGATNSVSWAHTVTNIGDSYGLHAILSTLLSLEC